MKNDKEQDKSKKGRKVPPMKQKKRIQIQFDIEYGGSPGREMDPLSETVPDMNLTVRQLLHDHTRGENNRSVIREPLYFETELPTINDITDVKQYQEQLSRRLNEVNEFIKEDKQKAEELEKLEEAKRKEAKQRESDAALGRQMRIDDEANKATK